MVNYYHSKYTGEEIDNSVTQTNLNSLKIVNIEEKLEFNNNGIFRGKDLTNVYTVDQLYAKVSAGDFDDLYLGDYITVSITTTLPDSTVVTEDVSLMIAAFNYYYNCGDTALTKPHLVLIPQSRFKTISVMNTTSTTEGGYLNSYMHTTLLPCYAASLKLALNNHLLSHRAWLTNAVNISISSMAGAGFTGGASGCEWATVELQLMNEIQLYGSNVWSSSPYDVGVDDRKLPVFDFISPMRYGRNTFWLRSVVSSTHFACCTSSGQASNSPVKFELYVRPIILFG